MNNRNQYHFYHKELTKLLKESNKVSFYSDEKIISRIINLLTESKTIEKISGIISTTEIAEYGGDIIDEDVEILYNEIINWWKDKDEYAT